VFPHWNAEFPKAKLKGVGLLNDIDVGRLYDKITTKVDPDRSRFPGLVSILSWLAAAMSRSAHSTPRASPSAPAISGLNLVMMNGSTLLGDEMLEMLVVLQMNREFMEFMRNELPATWCLQPRLQSNRLKPRLQSRAQTPCLCKPDCNRGR